MKGVSLRFYMNEFQKHNGILMYEWLLETAKKQGVKGGSVFKAIAGYGRNGILHEEHFFELASNVSVEVLFFLSKKEAIELVNVIKKEISQLFYSLSEIDFGTVDKF
jgi:uncharacterized protein